MWRNKAVHIVPVVLLVGALTFVTAVAQEESKTEGAPAQEQFPESTSLWKVETDTSIVYLMGSIHLLKETDFPLHPKVMKAFGEAGTLLLEAELDSAQTPGFQQYLLAKAVYDSGKTLQTELGDSVYSLLETQMASLGLAIDQMKQFEPWMVVLTFSSLKLQQLGFNPDFGVDKYFHEQAKTLGKAIGTLETLEYQIDVFDSLSPLSQRALVLQMLEQVDDIEKTLDTIVLQWKTGDLAGLETTINRSYAAFPEIRDVLLTKRNRNWIPKIEDCIRGRGTYLIVMGVTHMSGEEGVVALLRRAGYGVEQM